MALLSLAQQNEEMKKSMAPHEDNCRIYKDEVYGGLYLDYSECRLKSFQLPQWVSPKDVTRLNLERTDLKVVPSIIFQMTNLRRLDLRHNCLKSVPPEISKLCNLQMLKLAVNSLTELPEAICEMKSLEYLHLGANGITRLPKKFGNLRLKKLWINDNCFAHFPPQITDIITLEELYAQGNKIRILPEEINKLSNMAHFYIHKNRLKSLPRAIETLRKSKLTDFLYDSNKVKEFPLGPDQNTCISKINGTSPHCKDTKCKLFGAKPKQTNVKRNKSASTTKEAKEKDVDVKTTEEQTEASVAESSQLRVADQAPENGQLAAAMGQEHLHSPAVTQDVGAKATYIYNGPVTTTINYNYFQSPGVNNTDCLKVNNNNTMEAKDPLKDLIQHIADTAPRTWIKTVRRLGLTEDIIERIQAENQGETEECCIKALNLWRQRGGEDATVDVLKKALIDAGRMDIVDDFDAANCEPQDETTPDLGQKEEVTCIMKAVTSNNHNVESNRRRHSPREGTTNPVQDPQATTQPKSATSTLPQQHVEKRNRRCMMSHNSTTSHQKTKAQNNDQRSLSSTCAQPASIDSQPGRRNRQGNSTRSFNRQANNRRAELNQDKAEGGGRHRSRPGPNSSAGHETGAPDRYLRFPWNKSKPTSSWV